MKFGSKERVRKPLNRAPKVPLYYQSGAKTAEAKSPFKPKEAKRQKRRLVSKTVDFLIVLALVWGIVYSLIVNPSPKVIANNLSYHPLKTYTEAAAASLKKITNRNKLTLDEKGITRDIKKQFPEISTASVELPLFSQTPVIRLHIASSSFIFKSRDGAYVINSDGKLTGSAQDTPAAKNLPIITDLAGLPAEPGKQVLSTTDVIFIETIIIQSKHAAVPISSLELPVAAQELTLRTADRPYFVKFYLGGDALQQAGQFLAARANFDKNNNQPAQYLDVRIPGKIFYR